MTLIFAEAKPKCVVCCDDMFDEYCLDSVSDSDKKRKADLAKNSRLKRHGQMSAEGMIALIHIKYTV